MLAIEALNLMVSKLIETDFTLSVKHSRSTESVYLEIRDAHNPIYKIRFAHHRTTQLSYDRWINTNVPDDKLYRSINVALAEVEKRFNTEVPRLEIPVSDVPEVDPVTEKKTSYGDVHSGNVMALAQFYLQRRITFDSIRPEDEVKESAIVEAEEDVVQSPVLKEEMFPEWVYRITTHDQFPFIWIPILCLLVIYFFR